MSGTARPLVITRPLGGSALARAAASGSAPEGWYPPRPRTVAEWAARIELVRGEPDLGRALQELAPALAASGPAAQRLERTAAGRGVVVTTGQQPGLFGGPVYTWSKALSALAFADALERRTGVPVAPVFWAATDDADFEEARSTVVALPEGAERLTLDDPPAAGLPMSETPLGDVGSLIEQLERGGGSAAYAAAFRSLREAYDRPGATVGGAYVALLRAALEPLGIAVLDASHGAVRQAMHPLMCAALAHAGDVERSLEARHQAIRAAGFQAQVDAVPGRSLVFRFGPDGKDRVPISRAALAGREARPGELGPNVLLRPVAERAILPTVAYMAGPGELSYFAQASAVADALAATPPLALPRWSCTIVEPHVARILARYGLAPADLEQAHAAEMRLARQAAPPELTRAIDTLRETVEASLRDVADTAVTGDTPLVNSRVFEGTHTAMQHRIARLERRLVAAIARRDSEMRGDLATARGALHPFGKSQERMLNFMPLLARHGPDLLDAMRDEATRHATSLLAGPAHDPNPPRVAAAAEPSDQGGTGG